MMYALVSGSLFRAPESRTSKNGKDFVAGTLRFKDGESFQFVRFVAFSESVQAELMRLREGDAVAVQGSLRPELYRPDSGEPKLSLSIVVDQVMPLRPPARERKPTAPETQRHAWRPGDGPDDEISFGGRQ